MRTRTSLGGACGQCRRPDLAGFRISARCTARSPLTDVTATLLVTYTEEIPYETITRENDQLGPDLPRHRAGGLHGRGGRHRRDPRNRGRIQEHGRTILRAHGAERRVRNEIVEVGTRNALASAQAQFSVPLTSYTFTSAFKWRWGRLHGGVDLMVVGVAATPVYAADNGKVIAARFGQRVTATISSSITRTASRPYTGIIPELLVSKADRVAKGDRIAPGNTGNSTGPHSHFEIQVNDEKVDPQQYLTPVMKVLVTVTTALFMVHRGIPAFPIASPIWENGQCFQVRMRSLISALSHAPAPATAPRIRSRRGQPLHDIERARRPVQPQPQRPATRPPRPAPCRLTLHNSPRPSRRFPREYRTKPRVPVVWSAPSGPLVEPAARQRQRLMANRTRHPHITAEQVGQHRADARRDRAPALGPNRMPQSVTQPVAQI